MNPLYLHINHASGCIEEKNENKYLSFDSVDEKQRSFKKINRCLGWNKKK